jgi:hypothetical protein
VDWQQVLIGGAIDAVLVVATAISTYQVTKRTSAEERAHQRRMADDARRATIAREDELETRRVQLTAVDQTRNFVLSLVDLVVAIALRNDQAIERERSRFAAASSGRFDSALLGDPELIVAFVEGLSTLAPPNVVDRTELFIRARELRERLGAALSAVEIGIAGGTGLPEIVATPEQHERVGRAMGRLVEMMQELSTMIDALQRTDR